MAHLKKKEKNWRIVSLKVFYWSWINRRKLSGANVIQKEYNNVEVKTITYKTRKIIPRMGLLNVKLH